METSITFDSFAPIQSPSKNYKRQLFPVHDRKLYITVWKNTANLLDVVQLYSKQRRKKKKKKKKKISSLNLSPRKVASLFGTKRQIRMK